MIQEIVKNIYYCGIKDVQRKLFDELIPLPQGTSYNSYVVEGTEKTALIDTCYPPKINEYIENLTKNVKKIDYIIANHGEQDHSGTIFAVLEKYPDAIVVTNAKCKEIIQDMVHVEEDKFKVVCDNEELELGGKTLQFKIAPWVHWPDTMFTYIKEDELLFTCDFLGAHYTQFDLYSDDSQELLEAAKRYYAEIMMPFRTFCKKYVQMIKDMNVKTICPSHGAVYKNPSFILDAYEKWTCDTPENIVVLPYVSMYGSTKLLVEDLKSKLEAKGITVKVFDLIQADIGEIAVALVDAATLVLGSSMVLAGPHPAAVYAAFFVNALRPKLKNVSIIGSYGWGGNLAGKLQDILAPLKLQSLEGVIIKGKPKEEDFKKLDALVDAICEKHAEL
ncbi:MAG: FprA family A-type flavoprotein [Candidatus Gastranaerophilales bacterium]|nr:FprA family A-type flavoprotein [Candidatus Gastranaerophilales bacterium]